jgi:methyl-accepting chemotaxis protein
MTNAGSTQPANAAASGGSPPRYKRSVKNYLIDSRFQLKYTGFILFVSLMVAVPLGAFLFVTSNRVVDEGAKVVQESKKVSDVVKMSIKNDPIYGSDPELAKAFADAAGGNDEKIIAQQRALEGQQKTLLMALVGGLSLMVVLIGLLGIYFTHKVAGPIYMMKSLLKQVGEGRLNFNRRPRKGDELQDFFEAFTAMVAKLKERQELEVKQLGEAIDAAKASGASEEAVEKIERVRATMSAALDK